MLVSKATTSILVLFCVFNCNGYDCADLEQQVGVLYITILHAASEGREICMYTAGQQGELVTCSWVKTTSAMD